MNVMSHMSTLEASGLVRLAQVTPDLEYLFRHTLVQDAAYASLLDQDQKRLHQAVGEALETLYVDQIEELAPALAHHFENAGDCQRALHYFKLAAQSALHAYANPEAENLFRRALCVTEDPAEIAWLNAGLGEALYNLSRYEEAVRAWQEGIRNYRLVDNQDAVFRLYARSARAAWFTGDTQRGLQICEQGLEVIPGAPETPGLALLIHEAARACHFNGLQDRALELCHKALDMARRLNDIEVQADALTTLGILPTVPAEEALEALDRAIALAEEGGLLAIAARAHLNMGSMKKSLLGDQDAARTHYLRSAEFSRRRGSVQEEFMAMVGYASISFQLGEWDEVDSSLKQLESFPRRLPDPAAAQLEMDIIHSVLRTLRGEVELSLPPLRQAADYARQRGDLQTLGNVLSTLAELLLEQRRMGALPDATELEAALNEYLALAQRGMGSQAMAYAELAQLRALQHRFAEARQSIEAGRQSQESHYAMRDFLLAVAEVELAVEEDRLDDALAGFQALQVYQGQTSRWHWTRLDVSWAETLLKHGEPADLEHAQELLLKAQSSFEKMGSHQMVALTKNLLERSRTQTLALAQAQKKVSQELAQAGRIQSSFLPAQPLDLPGWDLAVSLRPARTTSGDYYDFIDLPNGRLGLVIADVADKGIGAALFMTSSRTLLRAYVADFPNQPDRALEAVNRRIMADTRGGSFITTFYAILDPSSGELLYANAGHNPPLLRRAIGIEQRLANTGVPLGLFADASWSAGRVFLGAGDILVLYTDGVTEAQNPQEELFGDQRLSEVVQAVAANSKGGSRSAQVRDAILQQIERFTAGAPPSDDITLLILCRE